MNHEQLALHHISIQDVHDAVRRAGLDFVSGCRFEGDLEPDAVWAALYGPAPG